MHFRPCIDLHEGKVKQIVGSSLADDGAPRTNFVAHDTPAWFARRYRDDQLPGGHVINLGPGNEAAAREALGAWPGGLHYGGGVSPENAGAWLDAGAGAVIVTSFLFEGGEFSPERLEALSRTVPRERLVIDLSCRQREGRFWVVTRRWQDWTRFEMTAENLGLLSRHACEFLIHAVDQEGRQAGVQGDLVELLGRIAPIPCVYAGGIHAWEDIALIERCGAGRMHFTVGSALDLFGGHGIQYADLVRREARLRGEAPAT
ncbi:MAG: phosphoribosylformimino-5-aminoimidazole carboxamide ribotide isomerase [Spirochaetes bacterium]|nr:phosphoribosylformimino-5-aminoimidazole carboxamide ribotide isomerase [Spirochaetota bacterium]